MPRLDPLGDFRPDVRRPMRWLLAFRFISNTGVRFAYSFLPALARGTGLSVSELGTVLALRDASGIFAPTIGRLTQRSGTVRIMGVGSTIATVSYFVAAMGATGLVFGLVLSGLGKIVFDVGMNAWVGDEIAYDRRARASGLVEMAWAGAALIGLPLCGVAIEQIGWQAAPVLLGLAAIGPMFAINRLHTTATHRHRPTVDVALRFTPTIVGALAGFCAMTAASQLLIVGHGLWLDETYGLDTTQIGLAVISIGAIEAVASAATATFTDRIGKRTAILGGAGLLTASCAVFVAMPAPPLAIGLAVLAAAFFGFEYAFVSCLPLLAELDTVSRAKMVGLALGSSTVVRAAGSPIGIIAFERGGFETLMALAAVSSTVTIALFWFLVDEPTSEPSENLVG